MAATHSRLLALPAELRNSIYEQVFANENGASVNLCQASPPSYALLLVCRQTYNEARSFYREAYPKYWSVGSFIIDQGSRAISDTKKLAVMALKTRDLKQVTSLRLSADKRRGAAAGLALRISSFTLVDVRGVWYSDFAINGKVR